MIIDLQENCWPCVCVCVCVCMCVCMCVCACVCVYVCVEKKKNNIGAQIQSRVFRSYLVQTLCFTSYETEARKAHEIIDLKQKWTSVTIESNSLILQMRKDSPKEEKWLVWGYTSIADGERLEAEYRVYLDDQVQISYVHSICFPTSIGIY